MSNDQFSEPPSDIERTIVRPRPGARHAQTPAPQPIADDPALPDEDAAPYRGANPLLTAAQPLLALVPQIRSTATMADPARFRESLTQGVRAFERSAQQAEVPHESCIAARYVLCTFLDETAASTPWGAGIWGGDSLLVRFHNEAWGGEKVFTLLSRLAEQPAKNRDLLALIYTCMALGFEGRYRVVDGGRAQLEQLRERLHLMLRNLQPAPERALSPRWAPATVRETSWMSALPVWVGSAVLALVALGVYVVLSMMLAARSDPVFGAIQSIRLASAAPPPKPAPAPRPRLAQFLQPEIAEGLVTVRDEANRSVVTIRGDSFFDPGSVDIASRVVPTINRIALALEQNPGRVLVAGHTDSQPIRTARFPSNWQLSLERARTVVHLMTGPVAADRMQAEGRADSEPVADNGTPAGRAQNRRVEITLFPTNP